MSASRAGREYFYGLDAVRFCAALMVVVFHLGRSINSPGSRGFAITQGQVVTSFGDYVQWGSVGVEIFFIVSGLVIANSANGVSPYRFLRSRAERLYPGTWLCASVSFLVWASNVRTPFHESLVAYVKTLTLFPFGPWIDAPYWTLGHEIVFYGVIWLVLLMGRIRNLEMVAIGIAAISGFYWFCRALVGIGGLSMPFLSVLDTGALRLFFPVYGGYFALGLFLWLHRHAGLTLAGRLLGLVALFSCLAPHLIPLIAQHAVSQGFYALLIGMVAVWASARFPSSRDDEGRFGRYLRTAGLATFPLYLLHFALGAEMIRQLADHGMAVDAAFVLTVTILVVLAVLVALGPEKFVRRQLGLFFDWLEGRQGLVGMVVRWLSTRNAPVVVRVRA